MTPDLFLRFGLDPALDLLPPLMDTPDARAMILAVCLQESRLMHRRQVGGPARGYPQFELIGVEGVLTHPKTSRFARDICFALDVGPTAPAIYLAMEFQDVLACAFSRLNLWRFPRRLPTRDEPDEGWQQYTQIWAPGKPRPLDWPQNFTDAWRLVA